MLVQKLEIIALATEVIRIRIFTQWKIKIIKEIIVGKTKTWKKITKF